MIDNGYNVLQRGNCYMIDNIPRIGSMLRVCVVMCDSLLTMMDDAYIEDQCTIYVVPTPAHVQESLTLTNKSIIDLMRNNIVLLHMVGIVTNIMRQCRYGVCCIPTISFTRRAWLDICTNKFHTYDTMLSASSNIHCDVELRNVYYHRCNNVLEMFGVEYIFCVYRNYLLHKLDPSKTVYVLRESDCASVITIE